MDFRNKKVLVFGSGKSGIAAAELLLTQQVKLLVFEGNSEAKTEEIRRKSKAFEYVFSKLI